MENAYLQKLREKYTGKKIVKNYTRDKESCDFFVSVNKPYKNNLAGTINYNTPRGNGVICDFDILLKDNIIKEIKPIESSIIIDCTIKYTTTRSYDTPQKVYKILDIILERITE